jgi:hypothetical protein
MEELVKGPKLWGLGSLTNSFGFLIRENQSFDFLKIAGHGSIIPRPYRPILSLKKRKDRTVFVLTNVFFQNDKNSGFKKFQLSNLE